MADGNRPGCAFEDRDVVEQYVFRPAYPAELYRRLASLVRTRERLLDLGCGTGKLARGLQGDFEAITALDPSVAMIEKARSLDTATFKNIRWQVGFAEDAPVLSEPYNLVVAGACLHWLNLPVVMPRLYHGTDDNHMIAVVDGDGAYEPPWESEWLQFLSRWVSAIKGEVFEPGPGSAYHARMNAWRSWVDVLGEETFDHEVTQSVEDFLRCQHSRDTFAPARLGGQLRIFDEELRSLLEPHAEQGLLCYTVRSSLAWGHINPG